MASPLGFGTSDGQAALKLSVAPIVPFVRLVSHKVTVAVLVVADIAIGIEMVAATTAAPRAAVRFGADGCHVSQRDEAKNPCFNFQVDIFRLILPFLGPPFLTQPLRCEHSRRTSDAATRPHASGIALTNQAMESRFKPTARQLAPDVNPGTLYCEM
jgi:hypothetical protein